MSRKTVERHFPGFLFTTPDELSPMNIQCCYIRPRPAPFVLMFYFHGRAGIGWPSWDETSASLDMCLLIGRQDKFIIIEKFATPDSLIEIKDTSGFRGEVRIAGKNPEAVLPRTNSIFIEPTPDGGVTDGGHEPGSTRFLRHLRDTPPRRREKVCGR